jgi:gluconokinase
MPASLLASQLAVLEPLEPDEPGVSIDGDAAPEVVFDAAVRALGLRDTDHSADGESLR